MRRVFVLTVHYLPIAGSQSTRVAKLLKYLPMHGWIPTIVSASADPIFGADPSLRAEIPSDATVVRVGTSQNPVGKLLATARVPDHISAWTPEAIRIALTLLRKKNHDVLASFSFPPSSHVAGLGVHLRTSLPWLADFSDPWMNNPYAGRTPRWRQLVGAYLQSAVLSHARRIGFTTAEFRDYVDRSNRDIRRKTVLLPNSAEGREFESIPLKRRENESFVVAHVGSLYGLRQPTKLLEAFSHFTQNHPKARAKLRLVGTWRPLRADVRKARDEIANVEIIGAVPRALALEYMLAADVLALIDPSPFEPGIFLPTKLIEYMMSGRPILALSVRGPVWDLVAKYDAGIAVRFDDVDQIANALETLYLKRNATFARNIRNLHEFEAVSVSERLAVALNEIS